jgi:hypothetical protein
MHDLILPLVLAGVALLYVSVLVAMRLGAAGVTPGRLWLAVAELWLTFGLIVVLLALMRSMLGEVGGASVGAELTDRWAHFLALPLLHQVGVAGLFAGVIGLFVHLVNSLRSAERAGVEAEAPEKETGDE